MQVSEYDSYSWGSWGECQGACNSQGTQTRTRYCSQTGVLNNVSSLGTVSTIGGRNTIKTNAGSYGNAYTGTLLVIDYKGKIHTFDWNGVKRISQVWPQNSINISTGEFYNGIAYPLSFEGYLVAPEQGLIRFAYRGNPTILTVVGVNTNFTKMRVNGYLIVMKAGNHSPNADIICRITNIINNSHMEIDISGQPVFDGLKDGYSYSGGEAGLSPAGWDSTFGYSVYRTFNGLFFYINPPCNDNIPMTESQTCYRTCPVDGYLTEWENVGDCSAVCGDGLQMQKRKCVAELNGGAPCPNLPLEQQIPCNLKPCPIDGKLGEWKDAEKCSASCGGGTVRQYRECIPPMYGGNPCPVDQPMEQYVSCNEHNCPEDGYLTEWKDASTCSKPCAGGIVKQTRECIEPKFGGKPCPNLPLEQTLLCNKQPCPIDGKLTDWVDAGECSATCGGGVKTQTRKCIQPEHGGKSCPDLSMEQEITCNEHECPLIKPDPEFSGAMVANIEKGFKNMMILLFLIIIVVAIKVVISMRAKTGVFNGAMINNEKK
jgi:hypothetical protein